MKKIIGFALPLAALLLIISEGISQITRGTAEKFEIISTPIREVEWDCWAADSGTVYDTTSYKYSGRVISFSVDPLVRPTWAPADNFDIRILDDRGFDILLGQGANTDSGAASHKAESVLGAVRNSTLRLEVLNARENGCFKIRALIR